LDAAWDLFSAACACGTEWRDEWDCLCNDRCPKCNKEIEPDDHEVIEANDEDDLTTGLSTEASGRGSFFLAYARAPHSPGIRSCRSLAGCAIERIAIFRSDALEPNRKAIDDYDAISSLR